MVNATEPYAEDGGFDPEPYCLTCQVPIGIFLARGRDWLHYRGDAVGKAQPYEAGHDIVIGWRPAVDGR